MRPPLSVLAGAVVAMIAAAVLGEYNFDGWAVIGSGALVGLFVAEAMLAVARRGTVVTTVGAAVLGGGAMLWAGWIATGHDLGTAPWRGWAAVAVAAVAGAVRARPRPAAAPSSPAAPATTE